MVGFILVLAPQASAHHTDNIVPTSTYPTTTCTTADVCHQDNASMTYFRESSLNATAKTNIFNVLTQKYNPTDLNVSEDNPPSYTGSSETDVVYRIGSVPGGAVGQTVCDDPLGGFGNYKCDQFYVTFISNNYSINDAIVCHETGHAVGLTHGAQAAPVKANSDQSLECLANPAPYVLGAHSVPQINGVY